MVSTCSNETCSVLVKWEGTSTKPLVPSSFVAFFFFAKNPSKDAGSYPLPFLLSSFTVSHDDAKVNYHASHTVTDRLILKLNKHNITHVYLGIISIMPHLIMNV